MLASQIVENTQGLMDKSLLLEPGVMQTVQQNMQQAVHLDEPYENISRKEELAQNAQTAQNQIDLLKKEISLDKREEKGITLFENGHVTIHDDEFSTILSEDGTKEYLVNKRNGTCKCNDHQYRVDGGIVCKHRIADKLARAARDAQNVA